ncbi:hypothetical protein E4S40_10940 [Algoriphagus kandeliae]|uniref:Uncharacterized protein n=1 Tax=Algoriphagus kandeliae TaxID=2562278 RepID=A0A4Y9QQP3_9BACT|nr:DUF6695 family protein [Algoriphagus kandeliae]TFV94527.1 hypothetical protein E4S40_10940 [Algoriphagus kandeliae]
MSVQNGVAIAIAWPEFVGKQTGTWYDKPMTFLGFNKDFHYQVGHASLVLFHKEDGICRYFDCGRYHAPYQYGRIRDESTDSVLSIRTKAIWENGNIQNFQDILQEIQRNPWTFGMGPLMASYCEINFDRAFEKVKAMQSLGSIPFGPFTIDGTNCCRFVRSGILAGSPKLSGLNQVLLNYLWHLKPMPITNVDLLKNKLVVSSEGEKIPVGKYHSKTAYTWETVHGTLPEPPKPKNIPIQSQWLAGEVAGSWFCLEMGEEGFRITRFSPEGVEECTGEFKSITDDVFDPEQPYEFTHLSHCSQVSLIQSGKRLVFQRIS